MAALFKHGVGILNIFGGKTNGACSSNIEERQHWGEWQRQQRRAYWGLQIISVESVLVNTNTHLVLINLLSNQRGAIIVVVAGTGAMCWCGADGVSDECQLTWKCFLGQRPARQR